MPTFAQEGVKLAEFLSSSRDMLQALLVSNNDLIARVSVPVELLIDAENSCLRWRVQR